MPLSGNHSENKIERKKNNIRKTSVNNIIYKKRNIYINNGNSTIILEHNEKHSILRSEIRLRV